MLNKSGIIESLANGSDHNLTAQRLRASRDVTQNLSVLVCKEM